MSALRGLLSIAIAWAAWLLGHAVLVWRGNDYLRHVVVRADWSGTSVVALLAVLVGCVLLAAAAASLALSWWGLLSVGVVQTALALLTIVSWSSPLAELILPGFLVRSLYVYHLFLGVHLVLGVSATALALAVALRPHFTITRSTARVISLVAVLPALVAVVPLAHGGQRSMRTLQTFSSPELFPLLLVLVAAGLLAVAAFGTALSGTGTAAAGALLSLFGLLGLLTPTTLVGLGSSSMFTYGLFQLMSTGGLLVVGLLLLVGALSSSIGARIPSAT